MSGYTRERFRKDVFSGLIVAIVALPLAMAFAIASGVTPERGLFTAIIAGASISIFGGSRVQIGGPTGAMIPILSLIVIQYGLSDLLLAGFVAGLMLILMGVFRAGTIIRFIPFPVTTGFTAGIAVILFCGQLNNLLGLTGLPRHAQFHLNLLSTMTHVSDLNRYALATATVAFGGVLLTPRVTSAIPGPLVAMVGASAVVTFLNWPVETIGSQFGGIPRTLPVPSFPALSFSALMRVVQPAFTIAVLGAIESLLSSVVADAKSGDKHDSNRELIGQGIANCLAPLFGGIPATGAIARTATNVRSGGSSPVAGVTHSFTILIIMLAFAPFAARVPLACLAPVLMVVAYNMSEIHQVRHILKGSRSDVLVLVVTFVLTVFADLTFAVQIGLLAAAVLFIRRMSEAHRIEKVLPDLTDVKNKVRAIGNRPNDCPQTAILTVEGALFFGAAQKFEEAVLEHVPRVRTLLLRMGKVPVMDVTGEKALRVIWEACQKRGVRLLMSGLQTQPRKLLDSTGLLHSLGGANLFSRTGPAIEVAVSLMDRPTCGDCPYSVFRECETLKKEGVAALHRATL